MNSYITRFLTLCVLALGLLSCTREKQPGVEADGWDGKVTVHFSVKLPETPGVILGSKTMADNPDIDDIHVAIFGGSGYLKEYVLAEPETQLATANGQLCTYKVRLSVNDSRLRMHIIANGPELIDFAYEDEVMSTIYTSGTQDAYWQRLILPHGVYVDQDKADLVPPVYQVPATFVEDNHLDSIPLIRNFAKVMAVSEAENFNLISFTLVNKPDRGTIAPYNNLTGEFVEGYKDSTYNQLFSSYPGRIPPSASIDKSIAAEANWADASDPTAGCYMFERPLPKEDPTFLLLKGYYKDMKTNVWDSDPSYYRLDLREGADYYAIYRNFRYKVRITGVAKRGAATANDAANGNGGGDVSSDINTQTLTDVSDGVARIAVQYTENTFTSAGAYELKYQFIPEIGQNHDNSLVTFELGPASAQGAVINSYSNGSTDDAQGWRTLTLNIGEPSASTRSQTIKVIGHKQDNSLIYRTVTIRIMSVQNMVVECDPRDVRKLVGEDLDVKVSIPKDLPRSVFPLIFDIESDANSLTPYNDNLPVYAGPTMIPAATGRTFFFKKTLSRTDYLALPQTASGDKVTFTCHFRTNKEESASVVYVANQYFYTASGTFGNFDYRSFENYHFESRVFEGIGERVLLSFNMSAQDPLQTVTMALTGLTPAPGETRLNRVGNTNRYTFTPTNAATNTFQFLTTSASEPVTVALSAPHYYDASVTDDRSKLDFTNPHFDASEYLVGIGRNVTYYFTYDEDYMENIVVVLTGLEPRSGNAGTLELIDGTTDSYAYTPSPGSTGTEALLLQTTGVSDNLSVKIYNTHYSEVTSTANRITYNFASLNISTNNVALGTGQSVAMNFQYQSGLAAQDVTVTLTNLGGSTPTSTSGTLTDNGDGTWNYHPNSTNANQTHYITATTSTYGAHVGISLESDGYNEREATKYRYVTIARQALSMTGGNATANRPRNKTISIRYGANNGSVATTFTGSNANPSLNGSAINWTADRDLTASDVIYLTYYYNNSSNNALWGVQTTLSALVGATNSNSGRLSLQFTQQ